MPEYISVFSVVECTVRPVMQIYFLTCYDSCINSYPGRVP